MRLSETFVDERLSVSFADQVARVPLINVYVAVQLLTYMERLYVGLARAAKGGKLPPVIALVVLGAVFTRD